MIKLHDIIPLLNDSAADLSLFWYRNLPKSYVSGELFTGVNFLLTGFNPVNALDSRFITEREVNKLNLCVGLNESSQNILVTSEDFEYVKIFSIPVYSLSQLDFPPLTENPAPRKLTIDEILYSVPYAVGVKTFYSNLHKKLYIKENEEFPENIFYHLALFLLQTSTNDEVKRYISSAPTIFQKIAIEIARIKMAYMVGTEIRRDIYAYAVLALLKRNPLVNNKKNLLYLLKAIVVGEEIARKILSPNLETMYKKLNGFISEENLREYYKWSSYSYMKDLMSQTLNSYDLAIKAKDNTTAYLHYYSKSEIPSLGSCDFYLTSVNDNGIATIVFKSDQKWEHTQLPIADVLTFNIDLSFKSCKIDRLK